MSNLRETIEEQSVQFAAAVVNALRGASLEELMTIAAAGVFPAASRPAAARPAAPKAPQAKAAAAPKAAGRRGRPAASNKAAATESRLTRRSADDIGDVLGKIVALLEENPKGLRSEQIKEQLGLDKKELPRPIAEGLSSGALTKEGNKRATTYFAGKRSKK